MSLWGLGPLTCAVLDCGARLNAPRGAHCKYALAGIYILASALHFAQNLAIDQSMLWDNMSMTASISNDPPH